MALFEKNNNNGVQEVQFFIVGGIYNGSAKIISGEEVKQVELITFDAVKKTAMAVLTNDMVEEELQQIEIVYINCMQDGKSKKYIIEPEGAVKRVGNHTVSFKGKLVEV